jgi:membrane protein YdbS with pleckstrin-like domain
MSASVRGPNPKFLRREYLANGEELRAETRATKLYFFPGPILALVVVLILDYAAAAATYTWLPAVPALTPFFGAFPAGGSWTGATFVLAFLLILTLAALVLLGVRYLRWIRTVYAVTSSRVIVQTGVFSREFEEIPISQVRGMDVHQTFAHRLLGFGTLRVSSEGGSKIGNEDWVGLPRPFDFQRAIENASQKIIRGESPPQTSPVPAPVPAAPARPV